MTYQLELDWEHFLANFWQKKPVIIRKAIANFQDPITAEELFSLAANEELDSRLIAKNHGNWLVNHGPIESFSHVADRAWTLLVQAVDHWHTVSANLITPFLKLPHWRFDDLMVSYSTPGGGVGPHIDNYGVFIIQGMGRRHWKVGENLPMEQFCPHPDLLHVESFDPIIDEILEPGDMLYIPPGFPHEGDSIETSLSYSVGFRAPNVRELVSSFADYLIENDLGKVHYSDPKLTLPKDPALISTEEIKELQALIASSLQDTSLLENWLGACLSTPRHVNDIAFPDPEYSTAEITELLQQGETVIKQNGIRLLRIGDFYYVNGEKIACSQSDFTTILAQNSRLDKTQLSAFMSDEHVLETLTSLINSGYWYFEN